MQVMAAMGTPHLLSAWKLMAPPTKVYCLLNLASIEHLRRPTTDHASTEAGEIKKKEVLLHSRLDLVEKYRGKRSCTTQDWTWWRNLVEKYIRERSCTTQDW